MKETLLTRAIGIYTSSRNLKGKKINMLIVITDIDDLRLCDSASIAKAFGKIFKLNFNSSPCVNNEIAATILKLSAASNFIGHDFSHHNKILQLSQMKPTNSVSPIRIPSIFLEKLAPVIAKPLSVLFRCFYLKDKIPDSCRHATILLIFKNFGFKNHVINYHPISLTCITSKIMEGIISKAMTDFFESRDLLYNEQYSFQTQAFYCNLSYVSKNDIIHWLDNK